MAEEGKYSSKSLSYVETDTRVLLDIVIDFDAAIPNAQPMLMYSLPVKRQK